MSNERIEYLYKYRPLYKGDKNKFELNKHTISLLTKGELFFSIPSEFNDPNDSLIPILSYKITENKF